MKKYKITIEGSGAILCNTRQRELDDEIKKLKKNELDEWDAKNWLRKAVTNNKDEVVLKRTWLNGVLINAAKFSGKVPHYATSKNERYTRYVESIAILNEPVLAHKNKFEPYGDYVDGNPTGKGSSKVWKTRPMLKKWKATFELMDPYGRMLLEELKYLLDFGGMFVGIGDGRKLNFGRFSVKKLEEVNNGKK